MEARVGVRREAIEAAVRAILGHVEAPAAGIDGDRLVVERAKRRADEALARDGRIALPHVAVLVLLAGEPGAPRRRAARAVGVRAAEDAVGVGDAPVRREADRRAARAGRQRLGVGDEDPAAVGRGVRGLAVGEGVPRVSRPGHDLAGAGDRAGAEPGRQPEAVGVRGLQRPVARLDGAGLGDQRGAPEAGAERQRARAGETRAQELPPPHPRHPARILDGGKAVLWSAHSTFNPRRSSTGSENEQLP